MSFSSDTLYTSGEYFRRKPGWDDDVTEWKAVMVKQLMDRNNVVAREVIEVGCGAGGILDYLSKNYPDATSWKGYDIAGDAIMLAKKRGLTSVEFFHEDYLKENSTSRTDLLLCLDVVEHIDDYYGFLDQLQNRANQFIFHIPLDLSCRSLLKPHIMLQQRNAVGHLHYFSREMVEWFLKDTGYEIIDWFYTKAEIDMDPSKTFKSLIKKYLRKFSFAVNEHLSAHLWGGYSMMILAKPIG